MVDSIRYLYRILKVDGILMVGLLKVDYGNFGWDFKFRL